MDDRELFRRLNQQILIDGLNDTVLQQVIDLRYQPIAFESFISTVYHDRIRDNTVRDFRKEELAEMIRTAERTVELNPNMQPRAGDRPANGLSPMGYIPEHLFGGGIKIDNVIAHYPDFAKVARNPRLRLAFCCSTPQPWFARIGKAIEETRRILMEMKAVKLGYEDWFKGYLLTAGLEYRGNERVMNSLCQTMSQVRYILDNIPELELPGREL
ncbi:hypothetical protein F53441_5410 [Fusarium austroafricanum]|uniref:Uncharacterized protein n=1 Tax=Fusarium austroafricanum TaxID=2364996 RepID=A0A8H4KK38_9HYPO|nr:hypothetical protein F53441_5410 [Fusarium austroafricanum]